MTTNTSVRFPLTAMNGLHEKKNTAYIFGAVPAQCVYLCCDPNVCVCVGALVILEPVKKPLLGPNPLNP